MGIEEEDVTGQPRSAKDIAMAVAFVCDEIVTGPLAMSPRYGPKVMHYMVIRDALVELLHLRSKDGT